MKKNKVIFIHIFTKNFEYKTHVSNYTRFIGPKIVIQCFLVSFFSIDSGNTFKMYMTSRAAKYCLAGRMWPVGRRLESPGLDCAVSPRLPRICTAWL